MPKLILQGVPPWDGTYDLDLTRFTNRETHVIKDISGVRAGELEDALKAGDNDVMVAITAITLRRAGKDVPVDDLWDADIGCATFDFSDVIAEDDAADPPTVPQHNGNGVLPDPSGSDSKNSGDPPANAPKATGSPGSGTSATSDPATSAT